MTKTITCDKCNGRGYFTFEQSGDGYAGVNVFRCEVCQGKGVVEVPVTNADHIRSMTDEELAEFLGDATYKENEQGYPVMRTANKVWWHKWLKQPFEEAI